MHGCFDFAVGLALCSEQSKQYDYDDEDDVALTICVIKGIILSDLCTIHSLRKCTKLVYSLQTSLLFTNKTTIKS